MDIDWSHCSGIYVRSASTETVETSLRRMKHGDTGQEESNRRNPAP